MPSIERRHLDQGPPPGQNERRQARATSDAIVTVARLATVRGIGYGLLIGAPFWIGLVCLVAWSPWS